MKFRLIKEEDDGTILDDIELTHYEFKQAFMMHKRLEPRK